MPSAQPFTMLCQQLARARPRVDRADLHLHTCHSDGLYRPAQVVELAVRAGLCAIAITDHDTISGVLPTQQAAVGKELEVIPAVEISCSFDQRELHLLAYFVRIDSGPLVEALATLRQHRRHRFQQMLQRLARLGVDVSTHDVSENPEETLGRRHLAELLVRQGKVATVREAFRRYLNDHSAVAVPKVLLPIAAALQAVHGAGGVASWAHPPESMTRRELTHLAELGLDALEVEYPGFRSSRIRELRTWATEMGLACTGGSDCHGVDSGERTVGASTISRAELEILRSRASFSARPPAPA